MLYREDDCVKILYDKSALNMGVLVVIFSVSLMDGCTFVPQLCTHHHILYDVFFLVIIAIDLLSPLYNAI